MAPARPKLEMRGMTSSGGNSPTVGFYLDDVPMTAPADSHRTARSSLIRRSMI
jgi:hypothetical protein